MSSIINTNSLSLLTQNNLTKSQSSLNTAIQRLSSGLRINSAKDDAAGQAIANRFTSNIKGLTQASRNANDGISMAQTTEGALGEINTNLQRIRELTVQSSNSTNSDADRTSIQAEIKQRLDEITRTSEQTDFNGTKVLNADQSLKIQVGAKDGETISIDLKKMDLAALQLTSFNVDGTGTANTAATKSDLTLATSWTQGTKGAVGYTTGSTFSTTGVADATTGAVTYTQSVGKVTTAAVAASVVAFTKATGANVLAAATTVGDKVTLNASTAEKDIYTVTGTGAAQKFNSTQVAESTQDAAVKTALTPTAGAQTSANVTINSTTQAVKIDSTGNITAADDNAAMYLGTDGNLSKTNASGASLATTTNLLASMQSAAAKSGSITLTSASGSTTSYANTGTGGANTWKTTQDLTQTDMLAKSAPGATTVTTGGKTYDITAAGAVTTGTGVNKAAVYQSDAAAPASTLIAATRANVFTTAATAGDTVKLTGGSSSLTNYSFVAGTTNQFVSTTTQATVGNTTAGSGAIGIDATKVGATVAANVTVDVTLASGGYTAPAGVGATFGGWVTNDSGTYVTVSGSATTAENGQYKVTVAANGTTTLNALTQPKEATPQVGVAATTVKGSVAATGGAADTGSLFAYSGTDASAPASGYVIKDTTGATPAYFSATVAASGAVTRGAALAAASGAPVGGVASYLVPTGTSTVSATVKIGGTDQKIVVDSTGNVKDDTGNQLYMDITGNLTQNTANGGTALTKANIGKGDDGDLLKSMNTDGPGASTKWTGGTITINQTSGSSVTLGAGVGGATTNGGDKWTVTESLTAADMQAKSAAGAAAVTTGGKTYDIAATGAVTSGGVAATLPPTAADLGPSKLTSATERNIAKVDEVVTAQASVSYTVQTNGAVMDSAGNRVFKDSDTTNVKGFSLADRSGTSSTTNPLSVLDNALKIVDTLRGALGAVQNRFDSVISNLGTTLTNLSSSRSRIEDADYATEVSNMTRAQILQQAGTSVLAKANQSTQGVMSLLQ